VPGAIDRAELVELVQSVPFWYHSIDLGEGVVTPGRKPPSAIAEHLDALRLPPLEGKTFLDIGAWDGYFSFEAERRGASRVVALDHFVWSLELQPQGVPLETPDAWQPERLPGKRGFDLAHRALGSGVEDRVGDFMTMDLAELGSFDVVLFSGVLYHLESPFEALRRLARVTREVAAIETEAICVPALEQHALCEFFGGAELHGDPSNWWAPNMKALQEMCRAAGFQRVNVVLGPPNPHEFDHLAVNRYRAIVHALK